MRGVIYSTLLGFTSLYKYTCPSYSGWPNLPSDPHPNVNNTPLTVKRQVCIPAQTTLAGLSPSSKQLRSSSIGSRYLDAAWCSGAIPSCPFYESPIMITLPSFVTSPECSCLKLLQQLIWETLEKYPGPCCLQELSPNPIAKLSLVRAKP